MWQNLTFLPSRIFFFLTYLFEDQQLHCTSVEPATLTIPCLSIDYGRYHQITFQRVITVNPMLQSFLVWPQGVQNSLCILCFSGKLDKIIKNVIEKNVQNKKWDNKK